MSQSYEVVLTICGTSEDIAKCDDAFLRRIVGDGEMQVRRGSRASQQLEVQWEYQSDWYDNVSALIEVGRANPRLWFSADYSCAEFGFHGLIVVASGTTHANCKWPDRARFVADIEAGDDSPEAQMF